MNRHAATLDLAQAGARTHCRTHDHWPYLLAVEALLGELLVVAGSAVDVIALGQEALRADRLLALKAHEALLVPHLVFILHVLGS